MDPGYVYEDQDGNAWWEPPTGVDDPYADIDYGDDD